MGLEVPIGGMDAPLCPHTAEPFGASLGPIARHSIQGAEPSAGEPQAAGEVARRFVAQIDLEVALVIQECALLVGRRLPNLVFE
ncbi:MAG: hypothetical protein JRG80_19325 [Deltaproteobacteria bacterium]|nr:hypothetical protein [Deltaproteobacteria bacterium]